MEELLEMIKTFENKAPYKQCVRFRELKQEYGDENFLAAFGITCKTFSSRYSFMLDDVDQYEGFVNYMQGVLKNRALPEPEKTKTQVINTIKLKVDQKFHERLQNRVCEYTDFLRSRDLPLDEIRKKLKQINDLYFEYRDFELWDMLVAFDMK